MKRFLLVSMMLLAAGAFIFAGGGQQDSRGTGTAGAGTSTRPAGDWKYKYPQPVTVSIGRTSSGNQTNYFDGEDYEHNRYTNWIKDTWNIEIKAGFSVNDGDYDQRVTLAMASGDLPDIMLVHNRQQLMELMESGMVEDLTGLFDQWASPLYKATIESFGGLENAMPTTFVNGRQYANALTHGSGQDPLFWIREDWRLKLGLPEPQTTDDFIKLAQAFVDNDMAGNKMTAGLEIQVPIAGSYNDVMRADPYFAEAGSYPRLWIDDSTGKIVYGSVAPQAKEGLRTLRDLYAKGLIPRDFVTRDHQAAIAAGYPGVVIGSWWISDWPLNYSVNNNPNALWRVYTWKSSKTGKRHTFQQPYNFSWAVVRKGYKNPEILTRLMNLTAEVRCFFDGPCLTAEEEKQYEIIIPLDVRDAYAGRQNINWTSWPINLQIDFNDQMVRLARIQQQNLDKYKAGNTSGIDASTLATLKNIVNYEKGTDRGFRAWSDYQRYVGMHYSLTDASTIDTKKTYWPYNTETMQLRWSNLTDLEALAYNKIIMGQEPLDYFDVFVKEWYDQGGTRITEEVNRQFGK